MTRRPMGIHLSLATKAELRPERAARAASEINRDVDRPQIRELSHGLFTSIGYSVALFGQPQCPPDTRGSLKCT